MRKYQVEQIKKHISGLYDVQWEIKHCMEEKTYQTADELVIACQELAIQIGNFIEQVECEGHVTVSHLESYCEVIFQVHEALQAGDETNSDLLFEELNKALATVEDSINDDIKIRKEAVFLPYKASMWDSLESVWKEAHADPDCDDYVIPIPYFERNPDGTVKEMHYEADLYPEYVPITKYDAFDFGAHRPDMMFIHNPYDGANYVTSVHPFFYSDNLKKYTDCLVYIPYFASAGGMSEGQAMCPAYLHVDYIVIQSEKFRNFYDASIPDEKFLAFGSPKFDSVIQKCQNPPKPSKEWQEKMTKADGSKKTVYFYNTSIGCMLDHTEKYLKKMAYVFELFKKREDACLLWRPHPLLESTFDSMRPQYKQRFLELKRQFIQEDIGIYDDTPNMEDTIAVSDVYIGDSASSVVSLFGVAGKPIFLFHFGITEELQEDDWKADYYNKSPRVDGQNQYVVQPNNKLYYSPNNDLHYEFFCDLSDYAGGFYYNGAIAYRGNIYVMPANAQHILVIDEKSKQKRKIELVKEIEKAGAFAGFAFWNNVIYLYPNNYPSLVIFDLEKEEVSYLSGLRDFNVGEIGGERVAAAKWIWRNRFYFLNVAGDKLLSFDLERLDVTVQDVDFGRLLIGMASSEIDGETLWLIPYEGTVMTRWDPMTGEKKDIDLQIDGLQSIHPKYKEACNVRYFSNVGFAKQQMIVSPAWGNKFVAFDPETGKKSEWVPPFHFSLENQSTYMENWDRGRFLRNLYDKSYRYYYSPERRTYDIDLDAGTCKPVAIKYDKEEVARHVPGFAGWSEWTQYICAEDTFNTLDRLLDNTIQGGQFDRETQLKAYGNINASPDGDCGRKVYEYIKGL